MMALKKLSAKELSFVDYYCSNGKNATKAAISAGYSEKTARQIGSQLALRDRVKDAIKEKESEVAERNKITVDSLISELEEARVIALSMENPQVSAAISATMGKAKLTGLDQPEGREGKEAQALDITFKVSEPVKEITVTKGK